MKPRKASRTNELVLDEKRALEEISFTISFFPKPILVRSV
jgi:hypothetical protein